MDQRELPHLGQLRQLLRIEPVALAAHVPPPPSIVGDVGHLRLEPKSTCQIAQPARQRAYLKDDTVGLEVNEQFVQNLRGCTHGGVFGSFAIGNQKVCSGLEFAQVQ